VNSFYSPEELKNIGLNKYGENVLISRYANFYSPHKITIGDNVRIDDFCILSGDITLGSHIHIAAYVVLYGGDNEIVLENYTGISARSTIYSTMDDFSGDYLIGPIHSKEYTNLTGGKVILQSFSQIGANCIIFPNITIGRGSVIGACSLVTKSIDEWGIYIGIPAKKIKDRRKNLLKFFE